MSSYRNETQQNHKLPKLKLALTVSVLAVIVMVGAVAQYGMKRVSVGLTIMFAIVLTTATIVGVAKIAWRFYKRNGHWPTPKHWSTAKRRAETQQG